MNISDYDEFAKKNDQMGCTDQNLWHVEVVLSLSPPMAWLRAEANAVGFGKKRKRSHRHWCNRLWERSLTQGQRRFMSPGELHPGSFFLYTLTYWYHSV